MMSVVKNDVMINKHFSSMKICNKIVFLEEIGVKIWVQDKEQWATSSSIFKMNSWETWDLDFLYF